MRNTLIMDAGLVDFIEKLPLSKQIVTHIELLRKGVYLLHFLRTADFLPGQVVAISTDLSVPPRLYSICSGEQDEKLSVLFNLKSDGLLTPKLAQLSQGDPVWISTPFGAFLGDDQPAWWIAAGTGIAPFRSMMRSGMANGKTVIHGGRSADSFYFQNEFLSAFGENYIRCCSGEHAEGLYHGRLTQWMQEQDRLSKDQTYYLCGSAEMVVEVRDILIEKEIPIDKIMSEIYF